MCICLHARKFKFKVGFVYIEYKCAMANDSILIPTVPSKRKIVQQETFSQKNCVPGPASSLLNRCKNLAF